MRKSVIILLALLCVGAMIFVACNRQSSPAAVTAPVELTIFYSDNPTLPFRTDWLTVRKSEELFNAKIEWEVIPSSDYNTRVSLALNSGVNTPDAILYQSIAGENVSLAQNGAIVAVSDYSSWIPEWTARVREYGLQSDVDMLKLKDGKLYFLPRLFDVPFYDGGLLLREDLLERYNMSAPKTFDDLYNFLRRYKQENPSSYPMTVLVGPRVHYRFTQPSWGISLHSNGAGGSRVLSWDYARNTYFAGAISEQYREYMRYWNKLYSEGLFDPEMAEPINNDVWTRKMATGSAIATYAYYDQIGGIIAASSIPGIKVNMYPPLEGPGGAHHQQKSKTGTGILFPIATSRRSDFERVVKTIDQMFFSKTAELLWCIGVEGESYTMQGGTVVFPDSIVNSADGIYKSMQLRFGAGADPLQYLWINAREMTKYDENYADINRRVAAMDNAIQPIPPVPTYNDAVTAERASSLMGTLFDTFQVWDNAFFTGTRSLDTDWNTYVNEMTSRGINELLNLYNSNL
ncbi:MAG: extracellular solute-binding protein [Treponema sp.]|jgi:putative aldouronate transport system substrate-binding protein|nr:extracellular solute-binding protein [Treponema sp.]